MVTQPLPGDICRRHRIVRTWNLPDGGPLSAADMGRLAVVLASVVPEALGCARQQTNYGVHR